MRFVAGVVVAKGGEPDALMAALLTLAAQDIIIPDNVEKIDGKVS